MIVQEELVRAAAWRYISDAITKEEAIEMLKAKEAGKKDREVKVRELGWARSNHDWPDSADRCNSYPAYVTSAGWLGAWF